MMTRRLGQLYVGLVLYGLSMALLLRAGLGLDPWDVFHQGITDRTGWSFGTVVIVTGAAVLLLWLPLRQRPGVGTISNIIVIGIAVDVGLAVLPTSDHLALRIPALLAGVGLNGLAGALYIGARLGPGPRDGLMTGVVARTGGSIRLVRTVLEVSVLLTGWALGGTVGPGTVLYAVAIGPLVGLLLPRLTVAPPVVVVPPPRAPRPDLDELAHCVAGLGDDPLARLALADAVVDLETAAGGTLGAAAGDPLAVLQRRFGRAHRLLARSPGAARAVDIAALLDAIADPDAALLRACRTPGSAGSPSPRPARTWVGRGTPGPARSARTRPTGWAPPPAAGSR